MAINFNARNFIDLRTKTAVFLAPALRGSANGAADSINLAAVPAQQTVAVNLWTVGDFRRLEADQALKAGHERVCADVALAAEIFEYMSTGRLVLAIQPLQARTGFDGTLYDECLLRVTHPVGEATTAAPYIMALERLGLVRALDSFVAELVLRQLKAHRAQVLGMNISAQSAVADGWWNKIFAALQADRTVAQRLVVEITETAMMRDLAAATEFMRRLQALGCRIALDDFGMRRETVAKLAALPWDFVKTDASYLIKARFSGAAKERLKALIEQSAALAPVVIVEGAETPADCEAALQAGADGLQGYFIGMPRLSFPSRS